MIKIDIEVRDDGWADIRAWTDDERAEPKEWSTSVDCLAYVVRIERKQDWLRLLGVVQSLLDACVGEGKFDGTQRLS